MKKYLLIVILLLFQIFLAQRTCGTPQKMSNFFKANPDKVEYSKELRKFLETSRNLKRQGKVTSVITIPVELNLR